MKKHFFNIVFLITFIVNSNTFAQPLSLTDTYFRYVFSGNYPKAWYVLSEIKKKYPESAKTKLITADFYGVMFETSNNENYFIVSKKYVNSSVKILEKTKSKTDEDIFEIISAKSILLKMEMKRKNYFKVAKNIQSVIKYLEYALKNENKSDRMKLISGMYNYYTEIAKEDYPLLYPILIFYPSGDKKKGLELLKECTVSDDINVRTRSVLQLALIYYRDEKKSEETKYYFSKLLSEYPDNIIWQTEYYKALKKFNLISEIEKQKNIIKNKLSENKFLTSEQKKYFADIINNE